MVRASDKSPNSQIHQTIYNWVRVIISIYNCPKFELIAKLTPLMYGLLWQGVEGAPAAPPVNPSLTYNSLLLHLPELNLT